MCANIPKLVRHKLFGYIETPLCRENHYSSTLGNPYPLGVLIHVINQFPKGIVIIKYQILISTIVGQEHICLRDVIATTLSLGACSFFKVSIANCNNMYLVILIAITGFFPTMRSLNVLMYCYIFLQAQSHVFSIEFDS